MFEEEYDIESSEDEVILRYVRHISMRKDRVVRAKPNHFEIWNEQEFLNRFRLSKTTVRMLIEKIGDAIKSPSERNQALSPSEMTLLTLRFYASGSFLISIGDFIGVHKSTASKVIKKVSEAIARLRQEYIKFPNTQEDMQKLREKFYNIAKFPRCVGALDCSHIRIQSPGGNNSEEFRNRKNFFSINVQTISSPDLKILDIVARWPGSAHDSTIFNNSNIRGRFERGEFGENILVGDSGYPIKSYLITPLARVITREERLFNESQIRTRNPVERCYGVWKRRFPVLALGLRLNLERVEAVIIATAVLHNIACERNDEIPPTTEEAEAAIHLVNNMPNIRNENTIAQNNSTRLALINEYFSRL